MDLTQETEDSAVQDFLQILEEHRKNCEKQGKYVEAEIAKNRLEELKIHEENRRREAMRSRQIAERLGVEEAHMLEFQQFNAMWDAKMGEFEQHARELLDSMRARHAQELAEYRAQLEKEPERRPKFSKDLLNLRKIQDTLARQREYAEAYKIKLKADNMEQWELQKQKGSKSSRIGNLSEKFMQHQALELNALEKRIQSGRDELKRQRQLDLERLLQRYQNVKSELESQQNIERIRADKFLNTSMSTKMAISGRQGASPGSGKKVRAD